MVCDLAETYQIYDWHEFPPLYIATLVCGLKEDSRTKMAYSGQKIPLNTTLCAAIFDRVSTLCWLNSRDGQRGTNRPKSLLEELTTEKETVKGFASVDDFEAARAKIIRGE